MLFFLIYNFPLAVKVELQEKQAVNKASDSSLLLILMNILRETRQHAIWQPKAIKP